MSADSREQLVSSIPTHIAEFIDLPKELTAIDDVDILADYARARELAFLELLQVEKSAVGEENYLIYQESNNNSVKFGDAEKTLMSRVRRSRIAMVGFGVLTSIGLIKTTQLFVDSEFYMFDGSVPSSLQYHDVTDCYADPAGTQLLLNGQWREVEEGDDDSVDNCLTTLLGKLETDLEDSRDSNAVSPYLTDYEAFLDELRGLSADPGKTPAQTLVDKQNELQEAVISRDDYLTNKLLSSFVLLFPSLLLLVPTGISAENAINRRRSLSLLRVLRAYGYKYDEVKNALNKEVYADAESYDETMSHTMSNIGCDYEKDVTLLPLKKRKKNNKYDSRWSSLSALLDALNSVE